MTSKLLEPYSIPVPPQLAGLLKQTLGRTGNGFDEGAFLQQLHYWITNRETTGLVIEGSKWVYNSLKAWRTQFPWMSEYGLRKSIANLKKLGLIQTAQHWVSQYQRVMFYRIDYDRLQEFAGFLCEQSAPRRVNSDRIEVMTAHTTYTESTSEISSPERQTVVVPEKGVQGVDRPEESATHPVPSGAGVSDPAEDHSPGTSSGKISRLEASMFPDLKAKVAQAIALPSASLLPTSLRAAIEQYPDRVEPAIAYLQYQQQKRQIQNPAGYLYEAIGSGWDLSVPQAIVPAGFSEWFDRARAAGLVIAAMAIEGVHQTLHRELGWVPTVELMQVQV